MPASFLDATDPTIDPITGQRQQQYNGPYSAATYASAFTPGDPDQPDWTKPAAAVAAPSFVGSAAQPPADMGVSDPRKYGVTAPSSPTEVAPEEPGLDMGADAGGEVGKSFVPAAPSAPGPTVVPARHLNRVGGQDFSSYTAGMSPAAQAAVQALMHTSPDATATNLTTGQSFVMPGGTYADPNAAARAAKGADLQAAQQQEQEQRAKADAWKQQNSPSALQSQKTDDAIKLWNVQHPAAPAPAPAAPQPSAAYGDAQKVIGQLDPTNPQHIPIIAALRQMKPTDAAAPYGPMLQAGQVLHPPAQPGQQAMAGLGTASNVLDKSPDLKAQISQLAQQITAGHMDTAGYYAARQQRAAIEQEMVRRGADQTSAHLAVKGLLQQAAPSFVQAPQGSSSGLGDFAEQAVTRQEGQGGFLGTGVAPAALNPIFGVARFLARGHQADIDEKKRKASFLQE